MKQSFTIQYQHEDIPVSQQGEHHFTVHLRGKEVAIFLKQDNEGANHWFAEGSTEETPLTKELGDLIEKALHV